MNRRTLLYGLGVGLLAAPLAVEAQVAGKVWRIGVLSPGAPGRSAPLEAFRQGLRELGYVEGQNTIIAEKFAEDRTDRLTVLAQDLVQARVDEGLWTARSSETPFSRWITTPSSAPSGSIGTGTRSRTKCCCSSGRTARRSSSGPRNWRPTRRASPRRRGANAREPRRPAHRATHKVRAGHQPQDREGTGPDHPAIADPPR